MAFQIEPVSHVFAGPVYAQAPYPAYEYTMLFSIPIAPTHPPILQPT